MKRLRNKAAMRAAMNARDLTTREMALLCSCGETTIRLVLAGHAVNPQLARRIARVLRRPVNELFAAAESTTEQAIDDPEAVLA